MLKNHSIQGDFLVKPTVLLLVFLFSIMPIAPALAELSVDSATTGTVEPVSDTAGIDNTAVSASDTTGVGNTLENLIDTDSSVKTKTEENDGIGTEANTDTGKNDSKADDNKIKDKDSEQITLQATTAGSNSTVANSTSQASMKKLMPATDQTSGAMTYEYPITVPPGRNGIQPDLKLVYNNQFVEEGSIFGAGWSINIPYIERINRKGSDQLYAQNYFNSSLSGELNLISGDLWGAKIEKGDYFKYTYSNNFWTVKDKKGVLYTFGSTSSGRQDNPDDTTKVYKWMLEEIRDTNNNYIKYEYYKDDGQIYPSRIIYTGNGTTDGIFEINFSRNTRSDKTVVYKTGFMVRSNYYVNEINTKISGLLSRKYALTYINGANDARSVLASITEYGTDDSNNTITLPATSFNYQAKVPGWQSSYSISDLENKTQLVDVNGDGLPDMIYELTSTTTIYINNGSGWTYDPSWTMPKNPDYHYYQIILSGSDSTRFADVNGDGLVDIIDKTGGYRTWVYLNNGHGWEAAYTIFDLGSYDKLLDVNGDNLPDIYVHIYNADRIYINNGSGWTYDFSWKMPLHPEGFHNQIDISDGNYDQLADVNGDGLIDIIDKSGGYRTWVYLNSGHGWKSAYSIIDLSNITILTEINGDGLPDMINWENNTTRIYINKGTGWTYDLSWTMPLSPEGFHNQIDIFDGYNDRLVDVNGDGLADIIDKSGGYRTWVYLNSGNRVDSLVKIMNNEGGNSTITYKSSAQYKNGSTLLNPKLPIILETVSQITNDDGFGNSFKTQYSYEGGAMYFNNPFDRKFSGFAKATAVDDAGNKTTDYYHQGNATATSSGEYIDHFSKSGKIYRTEVADVSGNIYYKALNKWDRYDLGNGRNFVKLAQRLNMSYDGNSTHKDSAETYIYNDTTGNIMQKMQLGEVTGSDNGTYTDIGTDDYATAYVYASNTSANILGLLSDLTVTDHNSNKVKEDKYYYDSQSLGSVLKGNETKHEIWKSGSAYVNTQKTYDGIYGLIIIDTDANGKNMNYAYDANNLYPAIITDPLNHTSSYLYDYSSGQVKQKTDPNGRIFQYVFDGLDRLVAEKQPDQASPASLVNKATYAYTDTISAVKVQKTDYLDSGNTVNSYIYFDGLGRKIQERKQAEGGNYETKDYIYNNLDLLQKESLPYFSAGSDKTSATAVFLLYVTYNYDPLYRVVSAVDAVGSITNTYNDWKLTVTDKNGKTKDLYNDAYGNLIRVNEHNARNTYATFYYYDYSGNLTKMTDAQSNVRNFTYDGLGRLLKSEDLHAVSDTTFGSSTFAYDNAGNLTAKVDAKNQIINYTYDDTNRILTEDYAGQSGIEAAYTYDQGVNGIGRLYSVTTPSYSQTNAYDPLGNLATEAKTIGSSTYATAYTYDRQGNQVLITNPDNSIIKYEYGAGGLLNKVSRKESADAGYTEVVNNFDYSPLDLPTTVTYNNGMVTTNSYDAAKLYRLSSKVTAIAAGVHGQDIAYTYDKNGNITSLTDNSTTASKKTVVYAYDDLNRLISASTTAVAVGQAGYKETYSYSAIGNILSKTGQGSYTYAGNQGASYANPHAVTAIGSSAFAYDKNGNLVSDGTWTHTWDYNNQLIQSNTGSITDTYTYDISGERLSVANNTTATIYPTKYYNTTGATSTKHIFANGLEVATVTGTGAAAVVRYTATDHLTGANVVTNASNTVEELLDYLPFGTIRIDEKTGGYDSQRKFTGHEYDADTGLNYMNARYQNSTIGRFISQDNAFNLIGDVDALIRLTGDQQIILRLLSDPQQLNSYSYARNNPIVNKDSTGNIVETVADIVSLALSTRDFYQNPTFWNGVFVGLDGLGLAVPFIPSGIGYVRHGAQVAKIINYFNEVAGSARKSSTEIAKIYAKNISFNFSRRGWTSGKSGDNLANLVGHFAKHGDEVGAKSVGDYYNMANDFINAKGTHSFHDPDPRFSSDIIHFNTTTNQKVITDSSGKIKSYYVETRTSNINSYKNIINSQ